MSIDARAQVAIFTHFYSYVDPVWSLGQVCTLGRASRTKETLPDFREWCRVTAGYPTSMIIPQVDGLSTDTLVLGRHSLVLELRYMST